MYFYTEHIFHSRFGTNLESYIFKFYISSLVTVFGYNVPNNLIKWQIS